MGNAESADGSVLKTAAIAKHRMQIEKEQVESMSKALRPLASFRRGSIKRHCLQYAMTKAQVSEDPDGEILDLLFTLWDENGTGRIKCNDFIVGISILACRDEDFLGAIKFALQIADPQNSGMISSKNANLFLLSMCTTLSYFGDHVPSARQIYKIVDSIYDTMSFISLDSDDLTHGEFVRLVKSNRIVQDFFCTSRYSKAHGNSGKSVTFAPGDPEVRNISPQPQESDSIVDDENSMAESEYSTESGSQETTTIILTPLVRVPVSLGL